jgi:hypothetical protein
MKEPKQYIFEEWDSMCAKANKALHSDCPLLEDEVLAEMHKYVGAILIENENLLSIINVFAKESSWCADAWKDQPHIKALLDIANT